MMKKQRLSIALAAFLALPAITHAGDGVPHRLLPGPITECQP